MEGRFRSRPVSSATRSVFYDNFPGDAVVATADVVVISLAKEFNTSNVWEEWLDTRLSTRKRSAKLYCVVSLDSYAKMDTSAMTRWDWYSRVGERWSTS